MPALVPTDYYGRITWLGRTRSRADTLASVACARVDLTYAGITGEARSGLTRPSCARMRNQYPVGTDIRNVRQLSILSAEELAGIAQAMGLDDLNPEWVGASMVLSGLPDFTHVPPSSRLVAENGTALTIDMENRPCHFPGQEIERHLPGKGTAFKTAAQDRRGVTAWVEREGSLQIGERLRLHVPLQRAWQPEPAASPTP